MKIMIILCWTSKGEM